MCTLLHAGFHPAWRIPRSQIADLLDLRRTTEPSQSGRRSSLWPRASDSAEESANRSSLLARETMLRIGSDRNAPSCVTTEPTEVDPASLVAARLRRSGYPFLRSVVCEFSEGILTLAGTVPTFHLKQLAQELAAHTLGVIQVNNDLHVTGPSGRAASSVAAG